MNEVAGPDSVQNMRCTFGILPQCSTPGVPCSAPAAQNEIAQKAELFSLYLELVQRERVCQVI